MKRDNIAHKANAIYWILLLTGYIYTKDLTAFKGLQLAYSFGQSCMDFSLSVSSRRLGLLEVSYRIRLLTF